MDVREILKRDEGFSPTVYRCPEGKLTIGWGWNVEAEPIPEDIAEEILSRQISERFRGLERALPWFRSLDDARQKALICMAFQMGVKGVLGFKRMLKALREGNWELAYVEALDSRWARQTPKRAKRYAMVLRTGEEKYFTG